MTYRHLISWFCDWQGKTSCILPAKYYRMLKSTLNSVLNNYILTHIVVFSTVNFICCNTVQQFS